MKRKCLSHKRGQIKFGSISSGPYKQTNWELDFVRSRVKGPYIFSTDWTEPCVEGKR